MRNFGLILAAVAALVAAGCGGGSNSSSFAGASSSSSGGTAAAVAQVSVITSQPQIPSDGSKTATITALVRDANNNFLAGVNVQFHPTSGGITVTQATTDASGSAKATLTIAGEQDNRTITVTATAGTVSSTVDVGVVGTSLAVTGPTSLVTGSAAATYTVSLTDSSGTGIAGKAVAITSAKGNTLSAASLTTDANGHAIFQMTGVNAGTDTLSAAALGLTATESVVVSSQNFAFTAPAANTFVALGASQTVTLTWLNAGAPQTGQVVTFSTTRGLFTGGVVSTTATTNSAGVATVSISAASAGPAVITASVAGVVSAQLPLSFVATVPNSIDLQASPGTIPTQGQSTISAIVRDVNNNLVQGQTVNFQLTDVTGGKLSLGSAQTDVQGRAQTVYTASGTASATNGVSITASVQGTAVTNTVTLTVGGQTVFLSLGYGASIFENADSTQFILPFIVQAQDSAGNAVNGVTITLKVHSIRYGKGGYIIFGGAWVQTGTPGSSPPTPITVCANEDVFGTGIFLVSEDLNGNGKLDPGDIAAVSPGTVTTAASTFTVGSSTVTTNGSATLSVTYPEDHAEWVQVVLTATATVQGTETSTTSTFWLPIASKYITNTNATPPGFISPYGIATVCSNPN